jgi:hypothetical protein
VDIGDKSWGVRACQQYFNGIDPGKTLHIGDQFLSAGANDFKVRFQRSPRKREIYPQLPRLILTYFSLF